MALPYILAQNLEAQTLRARVGEAEDTERSARHSMRMAKLQMRLIKSQQKQRVAEGIAASLMHRVVEARLAHGGADPIVAAAEPVG